MKKVILVRHIKSDWTNAPANDFDRSVKEDRKKDAVAVAKEIMARKDAPELVVASPSVRTMQTAETVCKEWGYAKKDITTNQIIYDATTGDLLTAIHATPKKCNSVAIICHSPGIGDFINEYSDARIDHVPTSAAACITFDVREWKDITAKGKLNWFLNPKELNK